MMTLMRYLDDYLSRNTTKRQITVLLLSCKILVKGSLLIMSNLINADCFVWCGWKVTDIS